MPRTPQQFEEIRSEKKSLIKSVALELFAGQGYAATSISQIAREAHISKGLMYNYFESKEDLLKNIIRLFAVELGNMLDPNQDDKIEDKEAREFFDLFFDFLKIHRKEMRLFYQLSFQPEVIKLLSEMNMSNVVDKYMSMYKDYLSKKYPENSDFAAMDFTNILRGFSMQYALSSHPMPDDLFTRYKEHLKSVFIN